MKAALLALALVACGGVAPTVDDAGVTPTDDAAVFCDLGMHGGAVACDPNAAWWFVATTDEHESTFAACSHSSCPLGTACFVGAEVGYCR